MNISEVSREKDISADTIRYYERIGLIPPVKRTSGGIRDFDEEDMRWIDFAKCMRGAGLSIESLIEYIKLYGEGEHTNLARKNLLMEESEKLEAKMNELSAAHTRLKMKIEHYDELLK
ncbi:MerR family transcriptional regulator [Listeria fleischmannii 1991]|jgi:DNA-binding transcriptional MerR regulator|uniref:HTH-type transcriptional regulator AdhR n=2 Tax=Listeria fleischmannii TaxID=1069827 RepID=A0A2X3GH30_9LIST|nr:MerR family transcriptional regulator [Listeria fleischmannii]EMG28646.1 MerR family transcriptional regulator [Listeria fleischmannii subsp. fleischmannii LU2006-1]KMT59662.1 MerR family transcriptional regulator [Listeria fleischmannii 1991]SQC67438.1 HTH-type transcriptional regulator AdhR [Listeria fleischmannii subsp. fleischmannii]